MSKLPSLALSKKYWFNFLFAGTAFIALIIAIFLHNDAEQALQFSQNNYQQQLSTNTTAAQSAEVLKQNLGTYREFQQKGLIGQPQRLQWLETLIADVRHHAIPSVSFNLANTALATDTNTTYKHDTLTVKVTPMLLEMSFLHEGDFYRLLTELQSKSQGLFSVQGCTIQRNESAAEANDSSAQQGDFKGKCDLIWYSLADITQHWSQPHEP